MTTTTVESTTELAALRQRVAQLEAELAQSRELVASVHNFDRFVRCHLKGLGIGLGLFAADGRTASYISVTFEHVFGYSSDALLANPKLWMQSIDQDDLPRVMASIAEAQTGVNTETTFRIRRGAESRRVRARFLSVPSLGESVDFAVIVEDVTEKKLFEEALRESEQRFRALAVHSPMGIFQTDLAGNCLFVNDRYSTIAGVTADESLGKGWLKTLHPEDREELAARWKEATGSHVEFALEYRFVHDDGTLRWVLGSAVPISNDKGEVTSYLGSVHDITQRKQMEEMLRTSEQRFRLLSNCCPVGIFLSDEKGRINYANPRYQAITGFTAEELAGYGFLEAIHPDDRELAMNNWLAIAGSTRLHDVERRYIHRNGRNFWVRARSAPLIAPTGAVLGRVGTVEDITERRTAEKELRRSEARHRLLAEYSTDMISKHRPDGHYSYVSAACRQLLGYEPAELLGQNAYDYYHPEDLAAIRESHPSTTEPLCIPTVAYRVRRKDGQYIWFETVSKPVRDPESGSILKIIAVSRDITVRRRAAERLSESEARMRGILDTAGDGIVTVNEAGLIELFNHGAELLFGYSAEEVLGQDIRMLMSTADAAHFEHRARKWIGSRRPVAGTHQVFGKRKDDTLCELELRVGETVVAGKSIYTGILHDISERKRTEKMLRESEKLAAAGRIAARIAHEINNPLAGIKNSFLLVKDAIPPSHTYFNYVARIEDEINRIAKIVRQMFDLYRPDHVTLREISLSDTIQDVVALLTTLAPARDVRFAVDTVEVDRPVRLSEDSVRQVLYNIIANAIDASPLGGVVRIRASLAGGMVTVTVSDEGPGIPTTVRPHIYEPFFTTKDAQGTGGLGLGLPISRGIVEALQGKIEFESAVGSPTVFRVTLPLVKQ